MKIVLMLPVCRRWAGGGRQAIGSLNPVFVQSLTVSKACPISVQFRVFVSKDVNNVTRSQSLRLDCSYLTVIICSKSDQKLHRDKLQLMCYELAVYR